MPAGICPLYLKNNGKRSVVYGFDLELGIDDLMPRESLLGKFGQEWIGIKFLDIVYAGFVPFTGKEHHCSRHCGDAGGVADGLHAGLAIGGLV